MSVTYEMCEQAKTDALKLSENSYPQADTASKNAQCAVDSQSNWDRFKAWFTNWIKERIEEFNEWLKTFQETMNKIADWIKEEVLPWIFSPYYLMYASGKYARVATAVSGIGADMAKGQIQPQAGWKGVGAEGYETTRGQQQEAAVATSSMAQGLSETVSRVAVKMYNTAVSITVLITKTVADIWKEIGYLFDLKRWTEVIGQTNAALVTLSKGMLDLTKELVAYLTSGVAEVQSLRREVLKGTSLAGGDGWPNASPIMTQPNVPGEPPSWEDVD